MLATAKAAVVVSSGTAAAAGVGGAVADADAVASGTWAEEDGPACAGEVAVPWRKAASRARAP